MKQLFLHGGKINHTEIMYNILFIFWQKGLALAAGLQLVIA